MFSGLLFEDNFVQTLIIDVKVKQMDLSVASLRRRFQQIRLETVTEADESNGKCTVLNWNNR